MDPPRADIRLGYLCNNNCRFCCVANQRKINLSTEEVKRDLRLAKKNKAEKIVFTGGEPTVRKDIFELVSYAKEVGFRDILIITNGRMCSYEEFLDRLVKSGLTSICFSLPDHREDVFEHLTQVKGSFSQLMKAIENAKKYDLLVSTITVITKLNHKELPKITEYLINLNKKFPRFFSEFMFINPTDNAWTYREELVPKIKDVTPYVLKSLDLAKKNGLILNVEGIPFCYMQGYEDNIVELHMAKERVFVDPGKEPDFEYNKRRKVEGKVKAENCKNCRYDNVCEGVWNRYVEIYGDKEFDGSSLPKIKRKLLQVTIACNQRCIFCTMDKFLKREIANFKQKPLIERPTLSYGKSTEMLKREILLSSCDELIISGGEPTLRSDLSSLILYAKQIGVRKVSLNTNGIRLADIGFTKKLKDSGLDFILLSLHSQNNEDSEKICQIKGNFDKTLKGLKNCLEVGFTVNIVHVVYSGNYKNLLEFSRFIKQNFPKVNMIDFTFIKPNDENFQDRSNLVPKISEIQPYLFRALGFCKQNKIKFSIHNIPPCLLKGYGKFNNQMKEILKQSDNKLDGCYDMWLQNKRLNRELDEFGYKNQHCQICAFDKVCPGLIKEYSILYGTDELKPADKFSLKDAI